MIIKECRGGGITVVWPRPPLQIIIYKKFSPPTARGAFNYFSKMIRRVSLFPLVGRIDLQMRLRTSSSGAFFSPCVLPSTFHFHQPSSRFMVPALVGPIRSVSFKKRENVSDAEVIRPKGDQANNNNNKESASLDDQMDALYEKVFSKKRQDMAKDATTKENPFVKSWKSKLFDALFGNTSSLIMATVVLSLFFQLARERGEYQEYKRVTKLQLQDAQRNLRQHKSSIRQILEQTAEEAAEKEAEHVSGATNEKGKTKALLDAFVARVLQELEKQLPEQTASTSPTPTTVPAAERKGQCLQTTNTPHTQTHNATQTPTHTHTHTHTPHPNLLHSCGNLKFNNPNKQTVEYKKVVWWTAISTLGQTLHWMQSEAAHGWDQTHLTGVVVYNCCDCRPPTIQKFFTCASIKII